MVSQFSLVSLLVFALFISALCEQEISLADVVHGEVQSCRGCQLNSLPEVKSFIHEDLPKYDNIEFKHVQGAPPNLILYGESFKELKRIPLRDLNRQECNELLTKWGFKLKQDPKEDL